MVATFPIIFSFSIIFSVFYLMDLKKYKTLFNKYVHFI